MTDSARHRSSTIRPAKLTIPPQNQTSTAPTPTPTLHTARIRAHLAHLLPRHAAFSISLTIHQLNNVPLVHGEFGLKWKIKGVTSNSGTGILDKVKARKAKANLYSRSASATNAPPSMAKGSDTDNVSLFDVASASDAHSIANSSSNDHANSAAASALGHSMHIPIPAVIVSGNYPLPSPVVRSFSGTSSIASVDSVSSSPSNARFIHHHPGYLSADRSRQAPAPSATPTHDAQMFPNGDVSLKYSPAKGTTPFVKLKDHSVVWEQSLKFVVQMSVSRDSRELADCLAKLVVMQRVIPGDPDAPRNPRLGVVYLNLAQYVNAGIVTRRYLLRESKTNATLKLTVHLEHTAGELDYVAPRLPKDEILSGVAGILESSDVYRTRPRASDLYTRGPSDSSSNEAGTASGSDASSVISGSGASHGTPSQSNGRNHSHAHAHGRATAVKKQRRPFEVSKLPTIDDPRGTEKLIEALFNPTPVTQSSKLSPFTYLVEVEGEGDGDGDGDGEADRDREPHRVGRTAWPNKEQGDTNEADDDGSLYADSQDENEQNKADGAKTDYHSVRSQPSVQGSLRSKPSIRSLASKAGLQHDEEAQKTATISTMNIPTQGWTTERRTWWQKVLSSPSTGG